MKPRLKELVDEYESLFMPGGIQQAEEELDGLIDEIGDRKFSTMCEIGIADGGTLWLYSHLFANPETKFIITDMHIRPITIEVMKKITARTGVTFEVHECMNYKFRLKEQVDFLHIDGDHSYDATMNNYFINERMVVPGGIIIVHDTLLMEGPIKFREFIERSGVKNKTLRGSKTLCDCFGKNRINPDNKEFGMTIIYKE